MIKNSKSFLNILLILIIVIGLGGLLYYFSQKGNLKSTTNPRVYISPTTAIDETAMWKTYISERFDYSFKYPTDWELLPYNDSDPKILFGTHSLHNYSSTEIEKYMNHGIVDWKKFLDDKPAVKIDFTVYSKVINKIDNLEKHIENSLLEGTTKLSDGDLKIGNLNTQHYLATENLGPTDVKEIHYFVAYPNDDKAILVNLYFWNTDNYESLSKTNDWQILETILSTFKFNDNKSSSRCGVCGPQGIHNIDGAKCESGLVCKKGELTSTSYCIEENQSVRTCESTQNETGN